MPTELHDCHQGWYQNAADNWRNSGLLTGDEKRHLKTRVGTSKFCSLWCPCVFFTNFTAIDSFYGPYSGSRKEPDFMIRADNLRLPKVVMESGWSESWTRLMDDMNTWLVGGNGDVKVLILLKWNIIGTPDRVRGFVEVYSLDSSGMPRLRQTEVLFKTPLPL
jgi:hypothetical protein